MSDQRRTIEVPVEMAEAALAAYLAERGAVLTGTDPDELDRIMVALAAALEYAGIKRVTRLATNNIWGPNDTYTTIGDQQVDGTGIRPGMYGERWESGWRPIPSHAEHARRCDCLGHSDLCCRPECCTPVQPLEAFDE